MPLGGQGPGQVPPWSVSGHHTPCYLASSRPRGHIPASAWGEGVTTRKTSVSQTDPQHCCHHLYPLSVRSQGGDRYEMWVPRGIFKLVGSTRRALDINTCSRASCHTVIDMQASSQSAPKLSPSHVPGPRADVAGPFLSLATDRLPSLPRLDGQVNRLFQVLTVDNRVDRQWTASYAQVWREGRSGSRDRVGTDRGKDRGRPLPGTQGLALWGFLCVPTQTRPFVSGHLNCTQWGRRGTRKG